jgi:hypothetical protein
MSKDCATAIAKPQQHWLQRAIHGRAYGVQYALRMDCLTLLKEQHDDVKELFKQLK